LRTCDFKHKHRDQQDRRARALQAHGNLPPSQQPVS